MRPTPNTLIKKSKKLSGFTLVELIVVITILVILGTIAFTSLSGFSGGARDSSRVSDLTNLSKALDIVYQKTGSYPTPDNSFTVTYSGGTLWTQGTIGDATLNFINAGGGIKMNKKPTDPLTTNKEYTYSKLFYGNAYQIKSDWEGESITFNKEPENRDQRLVEEKEARFFSQDTFSKLLTSHLSLLTPVYAATGNPTLTYIKGNYNGIVAKTSTGTPNTVYLLAVPSLILNTNINSGTIALPTGTSTGFYIHNQTNSGGISFTPKLVFSSGSLPSNDTERVIFASGIAHAYSGTILATSSRIQPFITAASTNNTTALASLGGGVVSGSLGGDNRGDMSSVPAIVFTATGGVQTTINVGGINYKVHTFATVGSSAFRALTGTGIVEYLVVAGGGGGGYGGTGGGGGGGGAGGLLTATGYIIGSDKVATVTVGAGGGGASNGGNSVFDTVTTYGGGRGGVGGNASGMAGGSGGGGNPVGGSYGAGVAGQGYRGGYVGSLNQGDNGSAGGGGAGGPGVDNTWSNNGSGGGPGLISAISGSNITYARGGDGGNGTYWGNGQVGASGGANTGNGGGGAGYNGSCGAGGSGIVVIRYQIP